jgi:lipopolysaccharide/colanic/teichoic acid biosynthesis glycosyltransferase
MRCRSSSNAPRPFRLRRDFERKHTYFEQVENVIKACELEGVEVWLVADFFSTQISRTSLDELLGPPAAHFPHRARSLVAKSRQTAHGFFGALFAAGFDCSPVFLIALLIKLTSPGPVFFRQQRSGQNGAPFTLYKFRTMVTNAEQFKHELEAMNEMTGPVFKVTNDPRVTPARKIPAQIQPRRTAAAFQRPARRDEPRRPAPAARGRSQALQRPRPPPPLERQARLTCLWQVKGRNKISDFKDWVRLDLEYIDNWSLWLD